MEMAGREVGWWDGGIRRWGGGMVGWWKVERWRDGIVRGEVWWWEVGRWSGGIVGDGKVGRWREEVSMRVAHQISSLHRP